MRGLVWQCESYLTVKTGFRNDFLEPKLVTKLLPSSRSSMTSLESNMRELETHHPDYACLGRATFPPNPSSVGEDNVDRSVDISSRHFNQFILRREELASYAVDMFQRLDLLEPLGIPPLDMLKMVQVTETRYHDLPYHNFRHAFDVLQATYVLLHETGLAFIANKVELFALMATALLHDGAFELPIFVHDKGWKP